ncbi:uncharacterized protein LOC110699362 [Chenopodium quinoa]|uniref:Integrator complex subunit 7 n=1 Tax=Chenopodium quinoa TaxID=63459 RepID=A0A803M422_CHEQI|nr:uncharacterized protein LOC110699362 [Chenopodium quinoa]XP_021732575.1 uncharacterized protein LOC110699362 [Chenopodium quinoa]
MEKISATFAMGWSIELEKGLRSRKPGNPIESINLIGPRLKQWCMEPQPTLAMYNMFSLVPGEDRLFADAILLRLADTFVSGDRDMKISVIRVFLSILRHCKRKDGQALGFFSNMDEDNKMEYLRRVKVVLTAESVESRALALILLGCCAELAKDVAEIRHAILSALYSCHILEVKASLFAAEYFSEISDDFGFVFLENLLKHIKSPKTLPALRIAGARTFPKMGCSVLLAMKSYKAGAELIRKTLEEDILATMLISLTKLSLKASILISDQVGLLSSFLVQNTSLRLQGIVLRCVRYIGEHAACFLPVSAFPFQNLFRMLDEPNLPSALHCEVLHIFLKMLAYGMLDMLLNDVDEFMKLLGYVEDATRSPIPSVRFLAFQILVSISDKLKGRDELMLEDNPIITYPTGVVSVISDQITVLVRLVLDGTSNSQVEQELGSMLKLLLLLVENHTELSAFILDKLHFIIKNMAESQNIPLSAIQNPEVHKVVDTRSKQNCSMHVLMFYIYRFLVAFLETLEDSCAMTNETSCKLKLMVSFICDNNLFDCSTHTFFALLLHALVNWNHLMPEDKSGNSVQRLSGSPSKLVESDAFIYVCAENMLTGGYNWCAYKAGRYASCKGQWDVASFIFQHLEAKVQSELCCQWLKFLVKFSHSEKNVKVLLQKGSCCLLLDHVLVPLAVDGYIEKLVNVFDDTSSSVKILEAISLQTQTICFQRWFMTLRQKVLLVMVDMMKLLNDCLFPKAGAESSRSAGESDFTDGKPIVLKMKDMMSSAVRVSARLASMAKEYDMISSSFVDLDSRSFKEISALAFGCSMLAFCTEFIILIPNSPDFVDLTKESGYRQGVIIKDLAVRLWHTDSEICKNLMSLLKECQMPERSLHFLSGHGIPKVNHVSEDLLTLCRSSVRRLMKLQNERMSAEDEDAMWQAYKDRTQLLLNIVEAWIHIPFRVPKYFFRLRPTVGSFLISLSAGSRKENEICVSRGSQLALNLCIQLKNVTSDVCSRFSKVHCILSCKASSLGTRRNRQPSGKGWTSYQESETGILIELSKKLQCHVKKRTREFLNCGDDQSDSETVETCVCFETNGSVQGFSTCLLDVSAFSVGSYRIHWLSGGVDHQGACWSFLPLSPCPQFSVTESSSEMW